MAIPNKRRLPSGRGFLLTLFALFVVYYGAYLFLRGSLPAAPQFIAHRG